MKIGIVSDTHITSKFVTLPKKLLDGLKGSDMIIHAGDLVDLSALDALKNICPNVVAVCGNMDNDAARKRLAEKEIVKAGKYTIGVMHGRGAPGKLIEFLTEAFKKENPDIIVFGHSHEGYNRKHGNTLFFNPGSPTDNVFSPYNSYGIIEVNDGIEAKIIKI